MIHHWLDAAQHWPAVAFFLLVMLVVFAVATVIWIIALGVLFLGNLLLQDDVRTAWACTRLVFFPDYVEQLPGEVDWDA